MKTKPKNYTENFVKKEVKVLLDLLKSNPEIIYKGELFIEKEYTRQRYSEWKEAFKANNEISDTIEKIDEILETRAIVGGLKNKLCPSILKFHLINNYKWKEKSELVLNEAEEVLKDPYDDLTDEQKQEYRESWKAYVQRKYLTKRIQND